MRAGRYLGRTKTASGTYATLDRKVFALLPYRVTGLSLNVPRQAAAGQTVTVSGRLATTGPPGRHLIRIEAADPDGVSKIWFREKMWTGNGSFRLDLPLAWNETGGVWTVTATDVLSGTSAARRVTVIPAGAREGRAL